MKPIITFGIIAGIIVSLMLVVIFSVSGIDMSMGTVLGYGSMIVAFSTIFIGVKQYRDKQLGGNITFGKAFSIGLGITAIATIMYVASWLIISETIAQGFYEEYAQHTISNLQDKGLSAEELETQTQKIKDQMTMFQKPLFKIGMGIMEIFPVGLVISLISAFTLKKQS